MLSEPPYCAAPRDDTADLAVIAGSEVVLDAWMPKSKSFHETASEMSRSALISGAVGDSGFAKALVPPNQMRTLPLEASLESVMV